MRQIKFRAKRIDNGEWVEGHYYDDMGEHIIVAEGRHEVVDESTLGQFTGLKDKNEVEIYEGDVVKTDIAQTKELPYGNYAVQWNGTECRWLAWKKFGFITMKGNEEEHYEVIGNVTENKELLS